VLKVARTDFDMSYCSVADGTKASVIKRGDKVEPINSEEAKKMVKEKVFPAKRPDELSSGRTAELLSQLGGGGNTGVERPVIAERELEPEPEPEPAPRLPAAEPPAAREPAQREPAPKPTVTEPAARESVDANTSVNAEVIQTYPISLTDQRTLGIQHRGAWNLYSQKNYKAALDKFSELVDAYPDDNYLSAYWAGMSALKIKARKIEAQGWFERALDINPDYQPAIDELGKLQKK
jgi:TolA-binding protein